MKHLLIVLILLSATFSSAQIQIGQNINGDVADDLSGHSISLSADGTRVVIGSPAGNYGKGKVKIFQEQNGSWIQIGSDLKGKQYVDRFGYSVSISANGKRVAIGAYIPNEGTLSGYTRVYDEVGGNWIQIGTDILGENGGDRFGSSVSISKDGTTLAVGAPQNDGNGNWSGHVRIFRLDLGNWVQVGQDIDGEAANDFSGGSVSLSQTGDRVIIGATSNAGNGFKAGHARIYELSNGVWVQVGQDIDGSTRNLLGTSVAMSADGKRVVIGGPGTTGTMGLAKVFQENNGTWVQVGQNVTGIINYSGFGWSVSISSLGKKVGIGSPWNANGGVARIFEEKNSGWFQVGQNIIGNAQGDQAGYSVSINSDGLKLAVGAIHNSDNGTSAGQVRVFESVGTFGTVYLDNNQDCNYDFIEYGIEGVPLLISPGNYVVQTNLNGRWNIDLPPGNYSIAVDTTSLWKTVCSLPQTFTVVHQDSVLNVPEIALHAKYPCPAPDISIHMPFMRPCFTDQSIVVRVCNHPLATETLNYPIILVTLDSLLLPTYFGLPYTNLGNNQYEFQLNSLMSGQCGEFRIKATLKCTAQLGQALCMQAELTPIDSCMLDSFPNPFPPTVQPCLGPWDESHLDVNGYCSNDTLNFIVKNVGTGNMTCYSPVSVFIDGVLHLIDSVKLDTQQVATFSFPGIGESWHLQVEQHPNHPGSSHPRKTIENCGGLTGRTKINLFAQDDADPDIDIYCGEVRSSYDPNDKTGYPLGVTADHFINANQQIQYRIRFQNTGTDTAFTVVIRDTLDTDLDIFTVLSGVSSHAYSFRLYGQRVLEWTFNDIMLPDSNVNEPLSHGFVMFTVDQIPDLPEGTQITNSAGIYFDFNAPIITNQTLHTIHYPFAGPTCSDLTSTLSILPSTINGTSTVGYAVEVTELNQFDPDGSAIIVRIPADTRFTFAWDPSLTNVAFVAVDNTTWNYTGDNGLFHTFEYIGPITAGMSAAFGVVSTYDPQGTTGETTITATVVPGSGGECNFTNNVDSELLVYFD